MDEISTVLTMTVIICMTVIYTNNYLKYSICFYDLKRNSLQFISNIVKSIFQKIIPFEITLSFDPLSFTIIVLILLILLFVSS